MKLLSVIVALLFTFGVTTGIQNTWTKLGDVTISSQLDNESIILAGKENYISVKFKAANQPFQLNGIELFYVSGEVQTINIKTSIDAGLESGKFDLKPGQILKRVVFSYKLFPGKHNDNVIVELYGLK